MPKPLALESGQRGRGFRERARIRLALATTVVVLITGAAMILTAEDCNQAKAGYTLVASGTGFWA